MRRVPHNLAAEAYQAYNDAGDPETSWKTWDGRSVPQFHEVSENVQAKWQAAAEHAYSCGHRDATRESMTRVDDYFDDDNDFRTLDVLQKLREAEELLRELAQKAGRGPRGLALNALATDTWKTQAALAAVRSGCLPRQIG